MRKFIILLLLIVSVVPTYSRKRALVIGISEYRDTRWMKPRISAERDIIYVKKLLSQTGFSNADITVLKNRQATKKNIVKALKDLALKSQKGDIIYIHFSGHGQLMTDVNGDEKADVLGEKWDEAWIPYDASYSYDAIDHGERHLCDDEVGELMSAIQKKIGQKGEMLVFVDACHSGDSTRDFSDNDFSSMAVGDTLSYDDSTVVSRGTNCNFIIPKSSLKKKSTKPIKENWITISACKPYQLNSEMRDSQGLRIGMLTYGLYNAVSKLSSMNNEDFEKYISAFMKKNKHPQSIVGQSPLITGNRKNHFIKTAFK